MNISLFDRNKNIAVKNRDGWFSENVPGCYKLETFPNDSGGNELAWYMQSAPVVFCPMFFPLHARTSAEQIKLHCTSQMKRSVLFYFSIGKSGMIMELCNETNKRIYEFLDQLHVLDSYLLLTISFTLIFLTFQLYSITICDAWWCFEQTLL